MSKKNYIVVSRLLALGAIVLLWKWKYGGEKMFLGYVALTMSLALGILFILVELRPLLFKDKSSRLK